LVEDVPAPVIRPGGLLVATRASLISVGTERTTTDVARKSLAGKAMDRPDLVRKVVAKARKNGIAETVKLVSSRLDQPVALGYSCAGVVIDVGAGVEGFAVGDRVACAGQDYASHAEVVFVPRNLCARIPDGVSFDDAAFVTMGAIALQGVRQAEPKLGDVVAVIGLGLVGQLTARLLLANGCRVVASEPDAEKRALAELAGVESAVSPEALPAAVDALTGGNGADAVIIAASTKSNAPVVTAGLITRKKGRVIVVGAVGMEVPRESYYAKELELRLSTSYGPGRYDSDYEEKGIDYPYGYVRWTEQRNMGAFLDLIAGGRMDISPLVSRRLPIERAEDAYREILEGEGAPLGMLLTYDASLETARAPFLRRTDSTPADGVRLALIGAGSHVKDMLVPALRKIPATHFAAVCTQRGVNARTLADRVGASYSTTDYTAVLRDADVDAVVIGTRHDLHATITLDALRAGKHVFVEKPLCLTEEELDAIAALYPEKGMQGVVLTVGFNRRFSPHFVKARAFFDGRRDPLVMSYRVNAGALPPDHWTHDPAVGGGRIIGEACHFIDYMQALCGAPVNSVHARRIGQHTADLTEDQAVLSFGFADGSVGTVLYTAGGDRGLAKERLEAFADGRSVVMDDFARSELYRDGRKITFKTRGRDKGFTAQMENFCAAVAGREQPAMSFEEIAAATRATIYAVDSMRTGTVYPV
jgi:predicted dehydrogenase